MRVFLKVLLHAALINIKTPSPGKITSLYVKEMNGKDFFFYTKNSEVLKSSEK